MSARAITPPAPAARSGFSLIELAVLLAIYGSIASMAAVLGKEWIEKERVEATRNTLKTIELALENHAKLHGRLPCPGQISLTPENANYGLEAWEEGTETLDSDACLDATGSIIASNATNDVVFGSVPAQTLGLTKNEMRDQWDGLIVYYVTERATEESTFWSQPKDANYLEKDDAAAGNIIVQDGNLSNRLSNAMYALVSHGPNQHGAYSNSGARKANTSAGANEQENCDCNASAATTTLDRTLVDQLITAEFDDIIAFRERANFAP